MSVKGGAVPSGGESLEAVVARIDERVAGLVVRFDDFTDDEVHLRNDIAAIKEEARRDSTAVRLDMERQLHDLAADLSKHEQAVNPHPNQEDWLRRSVDRLAESMEGLRREIGAVGTEITTAKGTANGAGKVLSAIGAVGLIVLGAYIRQLMGG